jgi:hypothetical protein
VLLEFDADADIDVSLATCSNNWSACDSLRWTLTAGYFSLNAFSIRGMIEAATDGNTAIETRPRRFSRRSRTSWQAESRSMSTR